MAGRFAKGTGLFVEDLAAPGNFTKIANVKGIDGPNFKVDIKDTTTHSTVGNFKEKAAVLVDAGQLKFTANFDPDDPTLDPVLATSLFGSMKSLTSRNWQLRLPPSNPNKQMMAFAGFVIDHGFKFPVADIQEAMVTIEIDGEPVWGVFA